MSYLMSPRVIQGLDRWGNYFVKVKVMESVQFWGNCHQIILYGIITHLSVDQNDYHHDNFKIIFFCENLIFLLHIILHCQINMTMSLSESENVPLNKMEMTWCKTRLTFGSPIEAPVGQEIANFGACADWLPYWRHCYMHFLALIVFYIDQNFTEFCCCQLVITA